MINRLSNSKKNACFGKYNWKNHSCIFKTMINYTYYAFKCTMDYVTCILK